MSRPLRVLLLEDRKDDARLILADYHLPQFDALRALRLALSRSIVEAHEGRLTVACAGKDQGTTFSIELRAVPDPTSVPADPQQRPGVRPPQRPLKILLVEDDVTTARVLTRLLDKPPFAVKGANSLASGLAIATAEDFDLIISDIGLPDGSGLDLMRRLRTAHRVPKGIALSGFGTDEDLRRSKEAGFLAHLTKPVNLQDLEAMIRQVTSGEDRPAAVC